jgi:hypothetical protein
MEMGKTTASVRAFCKIRTGGARRLAPGREALNAGAHLAKLDAPVQKLDENTSPPWKTSGYALAVLTPA